MIARELMRQTFDLDAIIVWTRADRTRNPFIIDTNAGRSWSVQVITQPAIVATSVSDSGLRFT